MLIDTRLALDIGRQGTTFTGDIRLIYYSTSLGAHTLILMVGLMMHNTYFIVGSSIISLVEMLVDIGLLKSIFLVGYSISLGRYRVCQM